MDFDSAALLNNDRYHDGDPSQGIAASLISAAWMNNVTDEFNAITTAAGNTPDENDAGQAITAIQSLIATAKTEAISQAKSDLIAGAPSALDTLNKIAAAITNFAPIPSGTRMLFYQAAAPTGWTRLTTLNNHALKIDSNAGGTTAGTLNFDVVFRSSNTTGGGGGHTPSVHVSDTTLSSAQVPPVPIDIDTVGDNGSWHGSNANISSAQPPTHGSYSKRIYSGGGSSQHGHSAGADAVPDHIHSSPSTNVKYAVVIICERN